MLARAIPRTFGLINPSVIAQRAAYAIAISQRPRYSSTTPSTQKDQSNLPTLDVDAFKRSADFKRPISPHLSIYQPQVTWILSITHRATGAAVGGLIYIGALWYAVAPFTSASVAAACAALPLAVKLSAKAAIAFPMAFHSLNGVRHLIWDTASSLTLKGVYNTGYAVLAGTAVLGTLLTVM